MEKLDFKKEYKDLYLPKDKPVLVDVPEMTFIMVDGRGAPLHDEYHQAIEILYGLTFTIKMSKMSGKQPEGYIEYVVPPLEGLWWCNEAPFDLHQRDSWLWTSMIRQPDFVTPAVFEWAMEQCRKKKPATNFAKARLEKFTEGKCVQIMHVGPYSEEPATVEKLHAFISERGLKNMTGNVRKHHEIYLGDPRKTTPEKLKTVLRLPVE
ncbi:MAG: GyrI-like domain-containing protein [Tannerella sp.]|jgi:hypothetical protein|nr:GyrI-like domain-containing protein [Tannerella sp.]